MNEVVVCEQIEGSGLLKLAGSHAVLIDGKLWQSPPALGAALAGARALIVRNQTQVTAQLIASAPHLEVIGRAGVGLDNVDVVAASAAGIVVASTPDQNSLSVAELTIGLMLSLARHIPTADRDTRAGGWNRLRFVGTELHGRTLGVVGLGRIGVFVALRARAFGMQIIAHDDFVSPDGLGVTETQAALVTLPELLQHADFVTCHVPLSRATRGLFDYQRFCAMKSSAFFLNLSRGEVVEENGLIRALQEQRLAGAALDVREKEPPPASALAGMDNVILTPHIAAFTREGQERVVTTVCDDVDRVLRGLPAKNFVNFPLPRKSAAASGLGKKSA